MGRVVLALAQGLRNVKGLLYRPLLYTLKNKVYIFPSCHFLPILHTEVSDASRIRSYLLALSDPAPLSGYHHYAWVPCIEASIAF